MSPDDIKFWRGCRESLKFFTTQGLGFKWPKHYTEWENLIEKNQRSLTEAPRGSWKTFFFSIAYPLWRILRGKTEVLLVSDSEDQARKNLRLMRQVIEERDVLSPMRPTTKELWGTDMISFPNQSIAHIMGFGTSRRGIHPDLIIPDDIESENTKMSREDKDRMYFGVIAGMALPHTKIAAVGTPLEFGDILAQLSTNPVYVKWWKPADKAGVNQYPDIWTDEWLELRKAEMGSFNYAREMLLQRIDPATQPFKVQYETFYTDIPPRFARIVTACDPAYTEDDGDYTAIVTVGFTHGNQAYVLEAEGLRKEDPAHVVSAFIKQIQKWKSDVAGIEKRKGDAISYSFQEARTRLNLWDFKYVELRSRGVSKSDRVRMVGGLIPRWEARAVKIHPEMKLLRAQLYAFRFDGESKGHDDLVDALAYCFHPDMNQPNAGKSNVPVDVETASAEGKPRYQVGQGSMWMPKETHQWSMGKTDSGGQWANMMDKRVGDAACT